MASEFEPHNRIEVFSARQAIGLVEKGLWDPSGMDLIFDRILEPRVLGVIKENGNFRLVTNRVKIDQEIQDATRILVEDAIHSTEGAEALLDIDFPVEEESRKLTDLIEDWNT